MPSYRIEFEFHPVGQGLFASGSIYSSQSNTCRFQWVYDCGTTSSQTLVTDAIGHFERRYPGRRIDLVTISHFDQDHISGISELLQRCPADTLLLPYMPLWQRLLIAFEEGISPDQPTMGFFIDPVTYITSLRDRAVNRILLVPPGDGRSLPPGEGIPVKPDEGNQPWLPEYKAQRLPDEDDEFSMPSGSPVQVEMLAPGAAITVAGLWEFIPYNDEEPRPISAAFRASVAARRNALLKATTVAARQNVLQKLKEEYDRFFGKNSKTRNVISLHLYGGPVYSSWESAMLDHPRRYIRWCCENHFADFGELLRGEARDLGQDSRCSVIYTGDGYLNTDDRLNRFCDYIRHQRISRTGVFQVMHHGASRNWHDGVAGRIRPLCSIFSSNPNHKKFKHPHPQVLRDFWNYNPIQVNQLIGSSIYGWMFPR